jgi:hypothetical protein
MRAPSPSYILSRSVFVIILLVVGLTASSYYKKNRRQAAIIEELQAISSDSSFYQQFYATDARKSLLKAVGLIAEANTLGITPETAIRRGLGLKQGMFDHEVVREDLPIRAQLIRDCLRANYASFRKLGYQPDTATLSALKAGELPQIPSGPHAGARPVVASLIDPQIAPGLDKVIANLEIRPPPEEDVKPNDIEIAAAKRLARELEDAGIIEETACDRILKQLSGQPVPDPAPAGKANPPK